MNSNDKNTIKYLTVGIVCFFAGSFLADFYQVKEIYKDVKSIKSQSYHIQNKVNQLSDSLDIDYNPKVRYGRK